MEWCLLVPGYRFDGTVPQINKRHQTAGGGWCPVTYRLLSVSRIIGNSMETSELDSGKHSLSLKLVLC